MFSYREFQIEPSLQNYVRKFWVLDNLLNISSLANKQILPNGCFNLAFIFGKGLIINQNQQQTELSEGIYLCGQFTSHLSIFIHPYTKVTLAQLFPWTPSMLSNLPFFEIDNDFALLSDALPCLRNMLSPAELIDEQRIQAFLTKKLQSHLKETNHNQLMQEACLLFKNSKGNLSIQELSKSMGFSTRFLEKKFKTHLGISPKEFATILKIRSLVDELKFAQTDFYFTDLAFQYGFYDQAHFIKTFKRILNITPKEFRASNYILSLQGKGF